MDPFSYTGQPFRVVFGAGTVAELGAEIERLNAKQALFCCTPGRADEVAALAAEQGALSAGICALAKPFVPYEVAEAGRAMARETGADCLVAYGGGTPIGLAKAIALELGLPIIAIVTTYSGSETTSIQGIIRDGVRTTYIEDRLLPKSIIYDPALMVGLAPELSVPSGFNSMAHGVSAFFGETTGSIDWLHAEEGIRAMASALARIALDPADIDARGDALYGAFLNGSTLMGGGVILHHKLVHVLGGDFGLPHANVHAIVLPHSVGYLSPAAPQAARRIARAFGDETQDAAGAIFDLLAKSGIPSALKRLGMKAEDLDVAAGRILTNPYYSPRPIDRPAVRALLDDIWEGRRPGEC
ncbi:MAG: maleylacetate reductase [Alphaproteobacteria bacterium]